MKEDKEKILEHVNYLLKAIKDKKQRIESTIEKIKSEEITNMDQAYDIIDDMKSYKFKDPFKPIFKSKSFILHLVCSVYETFGVDELIECCKIFNIGCHICEIANEVVCYFQEEYSGEFYCNVIARFHYTGDYFKKYYYLNSEYHQYIEDKGWECC